MRIGKAAYRRYEAEKHNTGPIDIEKRFIPGPLLGKQLHVLHVIGKVCP